MTEHSVDNSVSYTKSSGRKVLAFFLVFLVCGVGTIIKFDTYFTDFWKIRHCNPEGYERNEFMFRCIGGDGEIIKVDQYNSGSIFLGVQKDAIKYAEKADVVVFGNSRTKRSFSTDTIDSFFKEKGLSYVILASEGVGYKSALLTMENLNLNPKILMVNHEIFLAKEITPAFRELVDFPDKYKTRFTFFYNAQKFQRFICRSNFERLRNLYCNGTGRGRWRSVITSKENWNYIAPEEKQELILPNPDARLFAADLLVERSRELLEVRGYEETCPIWYIVNSPNAGPSSLKIAEKKLGIQTVFTNVDDLYTYDNSHLDRPNSEKWAREFIKVLEPTIDTCLSGGGRYTPKVEVPFDINTADIAGESDFETWSHRDGVTITDSIAEAPDGTMTADTFTVAKANVPIQKVYRATAIKAGTKMTFGAWLWSEDEMRIQLRLIKSCTRDSPMESFATTYDLTEKPERLTVSYTFEEDHGCALIRMVALQPDTSFNAWRARADYAVAQQEEEDEETEVLEEE